MSKRKDRERARKGQIFRNGRLVSKDQLEAGREKQRRVDDAVADLMTKKFKKGERK